MRTLKKTLMLLFAVLALTGYTQITMNDFYTKGVKSDNSIVRQQVSCGNDGMWNTIRYHPTIPGHVTMMGDIWCAYRSNNNGTRWHSITDHDGNGSFERQRDLIYSHSDPEFGISICGLLMWSTQDTGRTWQEVKNCPWYELGSDGLDRSSWKSKVAGLGMDRSNKNIWFVGGGKFVRDRSGAVQCLQYNNPMYRRSFSINRHGRNLVKIVYRGKTNIRKILKVAK